MAARPHKWAVFKSKTYEEGEAFYTLVLPGYRFFPWMHKTARLYKNWKDESEKLELLGFNEFDLRNYRRMEKKGEIESINGEEIRIIKHGIDGLPPEEKKRIYLGNELKIFPETPKNPGYEFTLQGISNLESKSISPENQNKDHDRIAI